MRMSPFFLPFSVFLISAFASRAPFLRVGAKTSLPAPLPIQVKAGSDAQQISNVQHTASGAHQYFAKVEARERQRATTRSRDRAADNGTQSGRVENGSKHPLPAWVTIAAARLTTHATAESPRPPTRALSVLHLLAKSFATHQAPRPVRVVGRPTHLVEDRGGHIYDFSEAGALEGVLPPAVDHQVAPGAPFRGEENT